MKDKFVELMKEAKEYLPLVSKGIDDKTLSEISEKFIDKSEREKFFRLSKQIEDIFEILQPDVFLRDYLEPYKQLTQLYKIVQNMFRPHEADVYKDLKNKTKELVRKHINLETLINSLPLYKIDEKVLERIERLKVLGKYEQRFFNIFNKKWFDLYQYLGNDFRSLKHWLGQAGIKRKYPGLNGKDMPIYSQKRDYQKIEKHNIDDLNTSEKLFKFLKKMNPELLPFK